MIYDVENTAKVGKPCRVVDANGQDVRFVVSCDTETGDVLRLKHDGESFVIGADGDVETISERVPAPLHIEWLEPS